MDSKTALQAVGEISVSSPAIISERAVPAASARFQTVPRVYSLCLVAFVILTRWFVAPAYLYYFDSANFAFALENFNPALHQPQTPGYPLFVGLTRLINYAFDDPQQIMLVAGLVGGIAAVLILLYLGTVMFGRAAGILASALLASDPVFWFGGVTNEVRIFLSLGMAAICLTAWRALQQPERAARLYLLFGTIAVAAGFRPIETWLLLPLALWVWWRTGHSAARLLRACVVLAAVTLPWLTAIVWRSGGVTRFLTIVQAYATSQFQGSSALYGAEPAAASSMLLKAVSWTLLGTFVWLWAIPFVVKSPRPRWSTRSTFLTLALVPPFLFAAFVHVGDPDQVLAGVTVLSLIGGAVLSRLLAHSSAARVYAAAAIVMAAHASDFYHPRFHIAEAASYGSVRNIDRLTTETISAIRSLHRDGPVTIVHFGSPVTFRQISWYFPTDVVHEFPGTPVKPADGPVFSYLRHQEIPAPDRAAARIGSGSRRIVCLAPKDTPEAALPGFRHEGPVFVLDNIPKGGVQIGGFRLIW